MSNEWTTVEHALAYLAMADRVPHRTEGEAVLLEEVPKDATRILDLGSGDGRLLGLLLLSCPAARGVALDFSPPMLERLRERFGSESRVRVVPRREGAPEVVLTGVWRPRRLAAQIELLAQAARARTPAD